MRPRRQRCCGSLKLVCLRVFGYVGFLASFFFNLKWVVCQAQIKPGAGSSSSWACSSAQLHVLVPNNSGMREHGFEVDRDHFV